METVICNDVAPAIGPYDHAIKSRGLIYTSGQLPLTKEGEMVERDIEKQTEQVMENLRLLLKGAGSSLDKALKVTVYLDNIDDFPRFNEVYASFFKQRFPARSTVEVSRLPKNSLIEIDCIAATSF